MTTPEEPGADGSSGDTPIADAPFLPDAAPTARGGAPMPLATDGIDAPSATGPSIPAIPTAPSAPAAPGDPSPAFDAKAMVESQKRGNHNPAYGGLPSATPEKIEAAKKLRAKAARKRRRNKVFTWALTVLVIGALAAGGWFGYQAYSDDQDAEPAPSRDRSAEEILDDLGSQGEMINAQNALNDALVPGGAGLGDIVDDARDLVGDVNGTPTESDNESPAGSRLALANVLPDIVVNLGERLPDASGRETYAIYVDDFSEGDPAAYAEFVRALAAQPQLAPSAPAFADLPAGEPDQIVISIARDADTLTRAIIRGPAANLYVDYAP